MTISKMLGITIDDSTEIFGEGRAKVFGISIESSENTIVTDPTLSNNLQLCWELNGNANDSTTNGRDGSISGATYTTSQEIITGYGSYYFDGINDYIGYLTNWAIGTKRTFEIWFKTDGAVTSGVAIGRRVNSSTREFLTNVAGTAKQGVSFYNGGSSGAGTLVSTTTVNTSTWFQMIITVDGNNAELFIDNSSEDTDSTSGKANSSIKTFLGKIETEGVYFKGWLSLFRIWDRVLTSDERSRLYNSGVGLKYS